MDLGDKIFTGTIVFVLLGALLRPLYDKPAPPAPPSQACGSYTLSGPGGVEWAVTICPADKKP